MADQTQDELMFSEEQQAFLDKRIGQARIKAREKAEADFRAAEGKAASVAEQAKLETDKNWEKLLELHAARVKELEPFEAEAKAYRKWVTHGLQDAVKRLGEAAKTAVAALPESMSDLDKLTWLNANEALFAEVTSKVGTPAGKRKRSKKNVADRRPVHL